MGPNLWELVERISNPDKWREKKVQELRNLWGYDKNHAIRSQGSISSPTSIYTDSLPITLDEQIKAKYPVLMRAQEQTDLSNAAEAKKFQGAPEWANERYWINQNRKEKLML